MFLSGAPDNIKQWKCPNGNFLQNMSGHNAVINTLAINSDEVVFSGGTCGFFFFILFARPLPCAQPSPG